MASWMRKSTTDDEGKTSRHVWRTPPRSGAEAESYGLEGEHSRPRAPSVPDAARPSLKRPSSRIPSPAVNVGVTGDSTSSAAALRDAEVQLAQSHCSLSLEASSPNLNAELHAIWQVLARLSSNPCQQTQSESTPVEILRAEQQDFSSRLEALSSALAEFRAQSGESLSKLMSDNDRQVKDMTQILSSFQAQLTKLESDLALLAGESGRVSIVERTAVALLGLDGDKTPSEELGRAVADRASLEQLLQEPPKCPAPVPSYSKLNGIRERLLEIRAKLTSSKPPQCAESEGELQHSPPPVLSAQAIRVVPPSESQQLLSFAEHKFEAKVEANLADHKEKTESKVIPEVVLPSAATPHHSIEERAKANASVAAEALASAAAAQGEQLQRDGNEECAVGLGEGVARLRGLCKEGAELARSPTRRVPTSAMHTARRSLRHRPNKEDTCPSTCDPIKACSPSRRASIPTVRPETRRALSEVFHGGARNT